MKNTRKKFQLEDLIKSTKNKILINQEITLSKNSAIEMELVNGIEVVDYKSKHIEFLLFGKDGDNWTDENINDRELCYDDKPILEQSDGWGYQEDKIKKDGVGLSKITKEIFKDLGKSIKNEKDVDGWEFLGSHHNRYYKQKIHDYKSWTWNFYTFNIG